jgi:hypothetical protein
MIARAESLKEQRCGGLTLRPSSWLNDTTEPSASGQYLRQTGNRICGCTLINYDPSGSG